MLGQTRVVTTALAATLISLSLCFGAEAQTVTLGQFQHPAGAKDLEFNKAYLLGALNGLLAFNAASDDKQFCLPGLIPKLTFEETNDVVIRWARKTSGSTDITLGQALMFGLKAAYPCRG
jgi:hypothetical protein